MPPEELISISITETDLWEYRQKISHCRYRSLSNSTYPLTQNYYLQKIILKYLFWEITKLTRHSLKISFLPGHPDSTKCPKITKNNSQGIVFVIISCQRVIPLQILTSGSKQINSVVSLVTTAPLARKVCQRLASFSK